MMPMNNPQALLSRYREFMSNPGQALSQAGIPQDMVKSPDDVIQRLLDTGRISQEQYTQARQMARQLQNMPGFH